MMTKATYNYCQRCNQSFEALRKNSRYPENFHPLLRVQLTGGGSHLPGQENYVEEEEQPMSNVRDDRNLSPEYRSLCETVTKTTELRDTEYEYLPPLYHEVYCKNHALINNLQNANPLIQECVHPPGFHCVQKSKTLFLVRRRRNSDCWEPDVKEIASGCDCMWPISTFGDIIEHYQSKESELRN
ncbi:uncharacterized protein LOC108625994 isoform X2 [Ceratina calcarata]|nr:uncharacterized protein LOC108625994 isoform X2 [Ceratina calcarata]